MLLWRCNLEKDAELQKARSLVTEKTQYVAELESTIRNLRKKKIATPQGKSLSSVRTGDNTMQSISAEPVARIPTTKTVRCAAVTPKGNLYKSQCEEDINLLLFFNGPTDTPLSARCGGTYVELGALDGVTYSNTYLFNKALGWKGVLIELSPKNFASLKKNRPDELALINGAVCSQEGTVHYVDQQSSVAGATSGVWEFFRSSFSRAMVGRSGRDQSTHHQLQPADEAAPASLRPLLR